MSAREPDLGSASFAAIGPGVFTQHFLLQILKEDARGIVLTITGSPPARTFIEQINAMGEYQVDVRGELQGKKINEIQTSHAFAAGFIVLSNNIRIPYHLTEF